MTNTNAGKDIVLNDVAFNAALTVYFRDVCGGNNHAIDIMPEVVRNSVITSVREIIQAYKAAEQKAVPGDEELVDLVAGAIWDATPTQCEMTWQEAKKMSVEIKWESTIIQHINMAKAALSAIRQHLSGDGWQGIESAPKDGTRILLGAIDGFRPYIGFYEEDTWRDLHYSGMHPTHWQPVPKPPLK